MALKIDGNLVYRKEYLSLNSLVKAEYESCTIRNCDFSDGSLSDISFIDCIFENCNLSMSTVRNTSFKTVKFLSCKLLGVNFSDCNPFLLSLNFGNCLMNLTSFYKLTLKGTTFKNCELQEADFTETDLTLSVFDNCNFERAIFDGSILERADFRTSFHYSIDPTVNRIKKAKFSRDGIAGLLYMYDIQIE